MSIVDRAIAKIQKAESLALRYQDYGFHLAFSGGKDSLAIYHLSKMAGVKFRPVMQVTTIDPPELMKFVRKNYPDVIMERPDINFYELIVKKRILPTRVARYCCQYLKEQSGAGAVVMLGIRKAESNKRAKRSELEVANKFSNTLDQFNIDTESKTVCIKGKDKIMFSPIIDWTDSDVWRFIRDNNIEYCSLYDKGYHRIGCILCPMASVKSRRLDCANYPGVVKKVKESIEELMNDGQYNNFEGDVDAVFDWWISNDSARSFLARKLQYKFEL